MNALTLIIPDLHLRVEQADKIIKHVKADTVISLGDVFDDFIEDPSSVRNAAEWYVDFVNNPNHIMLWGNHCQHYGFPYRSFQCSGYEQWKYFLINDIVPRSTWDKVKWYHFLDNRWLVTHAGLHKLNVPEKVMKHRKDRIKFVAAISEYLDTEILSGFRAGAEGVGSWVFNAGRSRGGMNNVGGITWCDHNQEMYPIIGLHQIYGHSPQQYGSPSWLIQDSNKSNPYFKLSNEWTPSKKQITSLNSSYNLCLDVWKNIHYAVWNGVKLSIYKL